MNFNHSLIVLKKEVKAILRDKRTWIAGVLIPTLLFPILFMIMDKSMDSVNRELAEGVRVSIVGADAELRGILSSNESLRIIETEDPDKALRDGTVNAVVVVPSTFREDIAAGLPTSITVKYDEASTQSTFGLNVVMNAVNDISRQVVAQRLHALGVDESILYPIAITADNISRLTEEGEEGGEGAAMLIGFMLPFIFVLYPVIGGMPVAIDLASGEKERQSLEPLLSTAASRMSILVGKYITVLISSVIGVAASIVGLYAATKMAPNMLPASVNISGESLIIMALVSLSMAMIMSGLMLAISTFARSYKEAGTYLSPLSIVCMLPVYLTMFKDIKDVTTVTFLIPIMNSVMLIKESVYGVNWVHAGITFGSTLVFIIGSLFIAKVMFEKESVIFRS